MSHHGHQINSSFLLESIINGLQYSSEDGTGRKGTKNVKKSVKYCTRALNSIV